MSTAAIAIIATPLLVSMARVPNVVDQLQLSIGAVKGSACELLLSRHGGAGRLTRFDTFPDALTATVDWKGWRACGRR